MPKAKRSVARDRTWLASAFGQHKPYDGYPLEYSVPLYYVNFDWDNLLGVMIEKKLLNRLPVDEPDFGSVIRAQHNSEQLFEMAQEQMISLLQDSDLFSAPRPEIGKKFIVHEDERFFPVFELLGKSGKHLVPIRFNDETTTRYSKAELLNPDLPDVDFDLEWCRSLACMDAEWTLCFSSDAVHDELHYLAASTLASELQEHYAPVLQKNLTKAYQRLSASLPSNPRYCW